MPTNEVNGSFNDTETSLGESFASLASQFTLSSLKEAAEKLIEATKEHGEEAVEKIESHVIQINMALAKLSRKELTKTQTSRIINRHKVNIRRWAERAGIAVNWELAKAYWNSIGSTVSLIGAVVELGSLFL